MNLSTPSEENIEEKIKNLAVELRMLENIAGDAQTKLGIIESVMREYNLAIATVQGLENLNENDELLMSVGGGSYLKVKIVDKEKVVVGIGANVHLEKPAKEALTFIENELNNLLKTRSSLQQQFSQILERMGAVRRELEQISSGIKT